MAEHVDLYAILNVPREADNDTIRSAYRKQALRTHPDRALPERKEASTAQFKLVSQAYEILSDPNRRRDYDLGRAHGSGVSAQPSAPAAQRPAPSPGFGFMPSFFGPPRSFFGDPMMRSSPFDDPFFGPRATFQDPFHGLSDPFAVFDRFFGLQRSRSAAPAFPSAFAPVGNDGFFSDPFFGFPSIAHSGPTTSSSVPFGGWPARISHESQIASPFGGRAEQAHTGQPERRSFLSRSASFQSRRDPNGDSANLSSRSTFTVNNNGRIETVTKEIAPDGTETVYRKSDEGESVTVNGVPQADHPLLSASRTRGGLIE